MRRDLLLALYLTLQITSSIATDNSQSISTAVGNATSSLDITSGASQITTVPGTPSSTITTTRKPSSLYASVSTTTDSLPTKDVVSTPTSASTLSVSPKSAYEKREPGPGKSTSTCPSREVNYITHGLPKQCLKSTEGRLWTEVTPTAVATENVNAEATRSLTGIESTVDAKTVEGGGKASVSPGDTSVGSIPEIVYTSTVEEEEADSPLDTARFLSFEEWKKQNLEKVGQSPEHVGHGRGKPDSSRQRPDISNLDAIGEDGELDFDFAGFGAGLDLGTQTAAAHREIASAKSGEQTAPDALHPLRSKDAGKTCKERYNYASFDCAATVLKTNAKCKSATSVLVESKDSYMLNECGVSNKFLVVELCDDILVDTVVLANFEFFSSMVRTFRVSVSDRYPPRSNQWVDLGTFEARNSREIQAFLIEGARVWARYMRIEFLTHYGNEFYCPLSLLRVHGITMMEEYKHEEELARQLAEGGRLAEGDEGTASEQEQGIEAVAEDKVVRAEVLLEEERQKASSSSEILPSSIMQAHVQHVGPAATRTTDTAVDQPVMMGSGGTSAENSAILTSRTPSKQDVPQEKTPQHTPVSDTNSKAGNALPTETSGRDQVARPNATMIISSSELVVEANATKIDKTANRNSSTITPLDTTSKTADQNHANASQNVLKKRDNVSEQHSKSGTQASTKSGTPEAPVANGTSTAASSSSTIPGSTNSTTSETPSAVRSSHNTTSSLADAKSSKSLSSMAPSAVQPAQATPSTQDSFFKSIHTRLRNLEVNATLSLQYVEAQAALLRDAFSAVEKRQMSKTLSFLNHLNSSVVEELKAYRRMYDELWQSTVIELESQREGWEKEVRRLGDGMGKLESEIIWLRGMGVVQMGLLVLCLSFVIFGTRSERTSFGAEMSTMLRRRFTAKETFARFEDYSGSSSPELPASPERMAKGIKRTASRLSLRRLFRDASRNSSHSSPAHSPDSAGIRRHPLAETNVSFDFSPPTPESASTPLTGDVQGSSQSINTPSTLGDGQDLSSLASPPPSAHLQEDYTADEEPTHRIRRPHSSPSTPQGSRDNPLEWVGSTSSDADHVKAGRLLESRHDMSDDLALEGRGSSESSGGSGASESEDFLDMLD